MQFVVLSLQLNIFTNLKKNRIFAVLIFVTKKAMKVPEHYYDEIFDFAGQWDVPSRCGLKIRDYNGKKIIIVTELYQENTGTSVTYNGASLAEQICQAKGISTDNMIYIECNPDTNSKLSFYDEEFFEVTFGRDADGHLCQPTYRQLTPEIIKEYGI